MLQYKWYKFEQEVDYMKSKLLEKIKSIFKAGGSNISTSKNNLEYVDLAPVDSIPNDSEYFKALDWALEDEKIKNIAISGPYGSGKSSIIETYLKNNKKVRKQAINISMASFESDFEITSPNAISMPMLEESVLKQLFYKVDYSKIPQSRYRKLHKINICKIYAYISAFIILSAFFIFVFFPDIMEKLPLKIKNAGDHFNLPLFADWIIFIFAILASVFLVSKLFLRLLSNAQIKEVKLPAETKVDNKPDPDSIFNKNLDEIMYFFEANDYRFVFFEDLDRFDNIEIFVKLRELNTLLNNYDNIKKHGRIIFVYAVKDDIFKNEDRTKFFDFIIPVIPIMNSTNAADVLIDILHIKNNERNHNISQEYIFDVAPYITDMRVLQNIYNEFILYKKTLQHLNLKDEEMMSLIIFKNIYPKDFSELQAENGIVKEAFDIINQKKKEVTQELESEINKNNQLLAEIDNDLLKEKRELKIVMMSALTEWNGHLIHIQDGNRNRFTLKDIMEDDFDINKLNCDQVLYVYYQLWNTSSTNTINANKEIIESYKKRWDSLFYEKKREIQKKIEDSKKKIHEVNEYSLQKLINKFGTKKILSDNVRENRLLTFLLRRGYINEKYANYINYFKGVSLTKEDMNFILSVKDNIPYKYDYTLTETDIISSRLQEFEFRSRAVYNYNLLEYLLSSNKYTDKLQAFIDQLSDGDEKSWDFVDGFIDNSKHKGTFIKLLAHTWTDMWESIYNNSSLTFERKVFYFRLILAYSDIEDLKEQDEPSNWSDFLDNKYLICAFMVENRNILQNLLDKSQEDILKVEKLKDVIEELGIKFECLETDNIEYSLIDFIFDNNYYVINKYMINEIVKYKNSSLLSDLIIKNYSTIRKLNYSPLLDNINDNLNIYMDSVFFDDKNTCEDIDSVIVLTKRFLEDEDMRNRIIHHENFHIANINDFCGDISEDNSNFVQLIWNQIFNENKVNAEWRNVNTYHKRFGFTTELKKYITLRCDTLMNSDCNDTADELIEDIIKSDMDDSVFEKIIQSIRIQDFNVPFDLISDCKMRILIDKNYISFSSSNYDSLVEAHPNLNSEFIIMNQDAYINIINKMAMESDLLIKLVKDQRGKRELKQALIDNFAVECMTDELAQIIINNEYIIDKNIFIEAWDAIEDNDKNKMLLRYFELLDCDGLEKCFKDLNIIYPYFSDRTKRRDVRMKLSNDTEKLASYLKKIGYITSFGIQNISKKHEKRKIFKDQNDTQEIVCKIKSISTS